MRPVMLLARLNEADLAVDATTARLAEVAEALKESAALQAARRALAQAETEMARCRATQRDRELAQKAMAEKLSRAQDRLYGGKVHNPKELENLERDLQQLRRQYAQAEDDLLEALLATEAAEGKSATCREAFARLTQEWEAMQAALRTEQNQLAGRLPAERARQAAARQAVPPGLLPVYDSLRARRGGRAVAKLDGDVCSACSVAVPASKLEVACYGEDLACCGNCGRIVWGE